jgi:hypothetical protein
MSFNPSNNPLVDEIKSKSAELIDLCNKMTADAHNNHHADRGEIARCCALAMTHYEDAAMWAVKAATA